MIDLNCNYEVEYELVNVNEKLEEDLEKLLRYRNIRFEEGDELKKKVKPNEDENWLFRLLDIK